MPGQGDCVTVERQLLEDCIAFLGEIKDKKLKTRKNAILERLQVALKPEQESVEANGTTVKDTTDNNDELYLPMDEPGAVGESTKPPPDIQLDEDLYLPMDDGDVQKKEEDEIPQEDYVDVETAKEEYIKTQSGELTTSVPSPSPSSENLTSDKKKGGLRGLKKEKKRMSESTDGIAMPDQTVVTMSGYLEYKSGVIGRSTKYWVALSHCSLYLAKSEDDSEAVKVVLLSGKTVERNRNQFDVRNKKDKHSFKADSADSAGKWVISVQEALLGTAPTEPTPVEMEESTEPEGDMYLPMEIDNQPPVDPSPGVTSPDVDEENYMVPDQPGVTHEQPGEIEQEEYDDIESVKESSKQFLTTELNQKGNSPSLSPAVSSENVSDKKRKSSLLTSKKKKNSDSSSDIAMPEKTAVILSGYLEYRSGVIGRSTKYWVSLSSCSLYLARSEDDSEAVKVILLPGMTVKSTKNQFEVKNKKDKHSFKAESTDVSNEWVSVLKGILEDKIPEEEASDEEKEKDEVSLAQDEVGEVYDDVENTLSSVPSIEISTSENTTPSHRPLDSPLPDLPPEDNQTSLASTATKAKTLIKGLIGTKKSKKSRTTRASSPMPSGNSIMKCGHIYMYKKHTFGGGEWERRYCAITGEGNLYFSSNEDESDCKGKIMLRAHVDKMKTKDAHGDKKVEEHPYLMLLAKNTFAFTSAKDRQEWKDDIQYSISDSLEIESDDEEETAGGYNVQSGTLQDADDYDDGDIYEAFDEVTPQNTQPVESKPPEVPAPRTKASLPPIPPPEDLIEEELYEDFDEAKNTAPSLPSRGPPSSGPSLPPRGPPSASGPSLPPPRGSTLSTGPSLPPRGPPSSSGPSLPPRGPPSANSPSLPPRNASHLPGMGPSLPSRGGEKETEPVEEIYDDTEAPIEQEIYDDVETGSPPQPVKLSPPKEEPAKQKSSPKFGKKFFGGSPKGSPKNSPKNSPKSSPRKSPAVSKHTVQPPPPPVAGDEPEEIYDDVEDQVAPKKTGITISVNSKSSPLLKKTNAPPKPVSQAEPEEFYDDVETAMAQTKGDTDNQDDLYMVADNEDVTKPVKQSPALRNREKSPSPSPISTARTKVSHPTTSKAVAPSPQRSRLHSSGKVADMMKKFQQDDGGSEVKCKGRIEHMAPGKKAYQKFWCQLKGKHMTFYQSSRDTDGDPMSKFDASECNMSLSKDDFNAKFAFKLSVGSVSHKMNCDSKREMDKWINHLKEVVNSCDIE